MRNTFLTLSILLLALQCTAFMQKPTITKVPAKHTSPSDGPEMYSSYCAVCHGSDGKGNGPAAPALKKEPTDLTQLSKNNGGQFPGLRISRVISGDDVSPSHGSRDMPIWGQVFRPMEDPAVTTMRLRNLTSYLESIQDK